MIADLPNVIKELANFTGYEVIMFIILLFYFFSFWYKCIIFQVKEDQIEKLVDHCNIEKFKKNDAVNMKPPKGVVPDEVRDNFTFIRKGKVGDWRNFFKDESKLKEFDHWIQTNNTLDIPIKYDLWKFDSLISMKTCTIKFKILVWSVVIAKNY